MNKQQTVAIIGTGMIGCSFAAAIRKNQPQQFTRILGYSSGKSCQKAHELGFIDEIASIQAIFTQADVILLSTPLLVMDAIIQTAPHPKPHQLVMDVGSVKNSTLQTVKTAWQENAANFVPCHPIAGLEQSGPEAASAELYKNKRVIITPDKITCHQKIQQATELWQICQADIHYMDAQKHDEILSKASHLPHILSFALVAGQYQRDGEACFEWSAGGLRDFTRIASSDPKMWHDICIANPTEIDNALSNYIQDLQKVQKLIQQGDGNAIKKLFQLSKTARDSFYQKTSSLNDEAIKKDKATSTNHDPCR